jgi:glycerate-2-kinase
MIKMPTKSVKNFNFMETDSLTRLQLLPPDCPIRVVEGARDNLPDQPSLEAAHQIAELASSLTEKDLLLVLVRV